MKKIAFSLTMLIIAFMLICGFWWIQTDHLISTIVKKQLALPGELSFERLEKRGFPFSVELALINPHLRNEVYELNTQGEWLIGKSVIGPYSWFTHHGASSLTKIGQNSQPELVASLTGNEEIKVLTADLTLPFKWHNLHELSYQGENLVITLYGEEPMVIDIDTGTLYLKNKAFDSSLRELALSLNIEGVQIHPQLDQTDLDRLAMTDLRKAVKLAVEKDSGKVNYKFKGIFKAPKDYDILSGQPLLPDNIFPFDASIAYESTGNLSNTSLALKVSMEKMADSLIKGELNFDFLADINPDIRSLFANWLMLALKSEKGLEIADKIKTSDLEKLFPNFQEKAPLKAKGDLKFYSAGNQNSQPVPVKIEFSAMAPPYQIEFKEMTTSDIPAELIANGQFLPAVLEVKVTNYKQLLADFVDYYNRWYKLLSRDELQLQSGLVEVPPIVTDLVERFVESVSDHPITAQQDLVITIRHPDELTLTVGTLSQETFWAAFYQLMEQVVLEMQPGLHESVSQNPTK